MSKIIRSGSGVYFENVRFRDLESRAGDADDDFFVRECPCELKSPDAPYDSLPASEPETEPDINAIREEAYARGREEGYLQGKKDGRGEVEEELHSAAQALAEGLEQISRLHQSLLTRSREDMVRLVMAVARQVIQVEVEEKAELVVKTVTRALEAAVASDEYYIKVHPEDLAQVKANEPLFLAAMKGLENIHFIPDEDISRGGCRAESQAGNVDATIETQLEKVEAHLKAEIVG